MRADDFEWALWAGKEVEGPHLGEQTLFVMGDVPIPALRRHLTVTGTNPLQGGPTGRLSAGKKLTSISGSSLPRQKRGRSIEPVTRRKYTGPD